MFSESVVCLDQRTWPGTVYVLTNHDFRNIGRMYVDSRAMLKKVCHFSYSYIAALITDASWVALRMSAGRIWSGGGHAFWNKYDEFASIILETPRPSLRNVKAACSSCNYMAHAGTQSSQCMQWHIRRGPDDKRLGGTFVFCSLVQLFSYV